MNIVIVMDDDTNTAAFTGGAYCVSTSEIHVEKRVDYELQRSLVVHEVIENYCRPWPHDKVDELTDLVMEVLDKLEEIHESGT